MPALDKLSDDVLLVLAQANRPESKQAWTLWFKRFAGRKRSSLLAQLRRQGVSAEVAEELAQDAMLTLYQENSPDDVWSVPQFSSLLTTILQCKANTWLKQEYRDTHYGRTDAAGEAEATPLEQF